MSTISDNTQLLGNRKATGTYHILFYRHDCPHCQRMVPPTYEHNKLTFHDNIQYRDIADNPSNFKLCNRLHLKYVPSMITAKFSHGKVIRSKVKIMTHPE